MIKIAKSKEFVANELLDIRRRVDFFRNVVRIIVNIGDNHIDRVDFNDFNVLIVYCFMDRDNVIFFFKI